ncbi:MAG: N-acetylmuramoyl-L-alanine amidase family protein [Defluviitaleaceae bacterium]|nr:N-acetylmuramoyl-L-alanine amidase family protein [Defluviitaleaceae bacterium]MCL2239935.1 N-acetylmuramoyl-L-alanine amidase family protein [Defluviitaleaceae bacterium]
MKRCTYKIVVMSCLLALLPFFHVARIYAALPQPVSLIVNGRTMAWRYQEPLRLNGRVFVPFREFTEYLGGEVGWHSGHQQVSLFHQGNILVLTVGNTNALLNGQRVDTEQPPFLAGGRVMIPLRFVAETLGYEVDWCRTRDAALVDSPNGNGNGAPSHDLPLIPLPPLTPEPPAVPEPPPEPEPGNETPAPEIPLPPLPPQDGHTADVGNGHLARNISTAPILPEVHMNTTITALHSPRETGSPAYVVQAFSAISAVTHFILPDNRLVVDIHSSLSALEGPFYVCATLPLLSVRSSQFSRAPNPNITRLVFELVGAVEFSLSLSNDRRFLTIAFAQNNINDVSLLSDAGADTLVIRGDSVPALRYSMDVANRRLLVEIDNATLHASGGQIYDSVFVSHIVTGTHPDGMAFVRAYLREGVDIPGVGLLNHGSDAVGLMLYGGIEGVTYDMWLRAVRLCRGAGFAMDITQIQRFNEYLRNRYTMVLPPAANALGQGIVPVSDGYINSFMLARDINGNTQLIFNTARVLAFEIIETPEAYYIMARLPREVHSLVVVLDPGHGGNDPGVYRGNLFESHLVLTLSQKVASLLSAHPYIGVYKTRHEDTNPGIFWRAEFARDFADVLLSIHVNGFTNPAVHGIETIYTISAAEAGLPFTSRNFAQIVQDNMIAQTGAHSRGLFNRPAIVVTRETGIVPSALAEVGFMTNAAEAARMATTDYQWQIARGLYYAILETHRQIGR